MLKIGSQLDDALAYESAIGAARATPHFDGEAKAMIGPSKRVGGGAQNVGSGQKARDGIGDIRIETDPVTGDIIGYLVCAD